MTALAALPSGRPQRLVYLGTPSIAVPPLQALVAAGFEVVLVVTRIDKRRGRGGALSPSPVKVAAQQLGLAVSHRVDDVLDASVDLGVVVAFGQLIKANVLAAVPMVNLHFSLLPRWRGAAPVERAMLAGDTVTGVSLMQLAEGLDDGPVLNVVEVPILPTDSVDELRGRLVGAGVRQLVDTLQHGLGAPQPQRGEVTYASKLTPDDFRIDWAQSSNDIDRLVRVGRAWTCFRGKRLKILSAAPTNAEGGPGTFIEPCIVGCGSGALVLTQVQPEGKPIMDALAWANGARPGARDTLESVHP